MQHRLRENQKDLRRRLNGREKQKPSLTALSEVPVVDSYPVLKRKLEEKAEAAGATEMSDDGEKFLLSIEGGKRAENNP